MKQFKDVSVELKGNSYFDGAVTSRTINFSDGSRKTLGFMMPGKYEFQTVEAELMEITFGKLEVRFSKGNKWIVVKSGEFFNVPSNSKFKVKVKEITDYCCSYL